MSHIFISYSRKDLEFAEKIINSLAKDELTPWIDWKSIPKGEVFEREILEGIEKSEIFLFLISPNSVQSYWCNKEVEHAAVNGKRILPIVIHDTDINTIPTEISKRNWIFCREGEDSFDTALEELRESIRADYEWVKYHTKLQGKANDWKNHNDHSRLLRGKELREAEKRLIEVGISKEPSFNNLQKEYIYSSQKAEKAQQRKFVISLVVGFIAMTALAIISLIARQNAETQKNIAMHNRIQGLSFQLAAQARQAVEEDYALGLLLAVQSFNFMDTADSRNTLDYVLQFEPRLLLSLRDNDYFALGSGAAISTDGSLVAASVGAANQIFIWDTHTGDLLDFLQMQTFEARHLLFSPDNKFLIAGDVNSARVPGIQADLLIWNLQTEEKRWFSLFEKGITASAFSPDSQTLALSGDGVIVLMDINTGNIVNRTPNRHTSFVVDLSFSPDGKLLASSGAEAILWDVPALSGKKLPGIKDVAVGITFSDDGQQIYATTLPSSFSIENIIESFGVASWDTNTRLLINFKEFPQATHPRPYWIKELNRLLVIKQGTPMYSIDPVSLDSSAEDLHARYNFSGLWSQVSGDGKLVTLADSGYLQVYDMLNKSRFTKTFSPYPELDNINSYIDFAWGRDENTFMTVYRLNGSDVHIWDSNTFDSMGTIEFDNSAKRISFNPSKNILAVAGISNISIWNMDEKKLTAGPIEHPARILSIRLSPEGEWLAVGAENGIVTIYTADTLKIAEEFKLGASSLVTLFDEVRFLSRDKLILNEVSSNLKLVSNFGESDLTIEPFYIPGLSPQLLWDVSGNGEVLAIYTNNTSFNGIEFWSLQAKQKLSHLRYESNISPLSKLSHTGNLFANLECERSYRDDINQVMCEKTRLSIIDTASSQKISELSLTSKYFLNSIFNSENSLVAISDTSSNIIFWDLDVEKRLLEACRIAGRNLSFDEWNRFIGADITYQKTCESHPLGFNAPSETSVKPDQTINYKEWTIEAYDLPTDLSLESTFYKPDYRGLDEQLHGLQFHEPVWFISNSSNQELYGIVELVITSLSSNELNRYRIPFTALPGLNMLRVPHSARVIQDPNEEVNIFRLYFQDVKTKIANPVSTDNIFSKLVSNQMEYFKNEKGKITLSVTNNEEFILKNARILGLLTDEAGVAIDYFSTTEMQNINIASGSNQDIILMADSSECKDFNCIDPEQKYTLHLWLYFNSQNEGNIMHYQTIELSDEFIKISLNAGKNVSYLQSSVIDEKIFKESDLNSTEISEHFNIGEFDFYVVNQPDGMAISTPNMLQCRENNDSYLLKEDFVVLWPFETSGNNYWVNGHAKLHLLSDNGIVSTDNVIFRSPANSSGLLMPSRNVEGYVNSGNDSGVTGFILVFDEWATMTTANNVPLDKVRINVLSHEVYGEAEFPQSRFLVALENLSESKLSNISIWGVVKNKDKQPVDIVTIWQGYYHSGYNEAHDDVLMSNYSNYYQLVSLSNTGRCVLPSNYLDGYNVELWASYLDETGQYYVAYEEFNTNDLSTP